MPPANLVPIADSPIPPAGPDFEFNIKTLAGVIILFFGMAAPTRAESFYDRHVVFDNSAADGSYYQSEGMVTPPSKLEMLDYKLPGGTNHFIVRASCPPPQR